MPSIRYRIVFMVNTVTQERRECFWRSVMSCKSVASGTMEETLIQITRHYRPLAQQHDAP